MRFGIRIIDDLGTPEELVALASLADEVGFDGLIFPASPMRANAWALCAAAARATERIEINVGGPIHTTDPSEIATYAATLDRQLATIFDAGFDHVSIGGPLGRSPAAAIRLIAERVLPAFRS